MMETENWNFSVVLVPLDVYLTPKYIIAFSILHYNRVCLCCVVLTLHYVITDFFCKQESKIEGVCEQKMTVITDKKYLKQLPLQVQLKITCMQCLNTFFIHHRCLHCNSKFNWWHLNSIIMCSLTSYSQHLTLYYSTCALFLKFLTFGFDYYHASQDFAISLYGLQHSPVSSTHF